MTREEKIMLELDHIRSRITDNLIHAENTVFFVGGRELKKAKCISQLEIIKEVIGTVGQILGEVEND